MFGTYLQQSFVLVLFYSGIPLIIASLVGLTVSIVQTATQIQEQTTGYLVKFAAVSVVLTILAGWFATEMVKFMAELFDSIAFLGRL